MAYCRKCGAKLDESARFCRLCGTPVEQTTAYYAHVKRRPISPLWPVVGVLIAILIVGAVIAALAFVPIQRVNFNQVKSQPLTAGIDMLNFDFDADAANVNIYCMNMPNQLAKVNVVTSGSIGLFGSAEDPLNVRFEPQTSGNVVTINAGISRPSPWPFSHNLEVRCDVYLNPTVALNLSVQTSVGTVTLETIGEQTVFQGLSLSATTGNVEATLLETTTLVASSASFITTTGSSQLTWDNAKVSGKTTLNVASTTGSVTVTVKQTQTLADDVSLNVATTTGSVNLELNISDNVGAKITSRTTFGSISTDVERFNGDKSPILSSNYPAESNFNVDLSTTTGGVNIVARYQPSGVPPFTRQEEIRDAVMEYIKTNHPETAQFMQSLSWTGGKVDRDVMIGAETYSWISGGWNVTLTYPIVPNPVYSVNADYKQQGLGIPYRVIWAGTWHNDKITETTYEFAQ